MRLERIDTEGKTKNELVARLATIDAQWETLKAMQAEADNATEMHIRMELMQLFHARKEVLYALEGMAP